MIEEALVAFLDANAAVNAECRKVFPHVIPADEEPPAITYRLDDDDLDPLLDGSSGSLTVARITLDAYATRKSKANAIAAALHAELNNYTGAFGSLTADHIRRDRKFGLFETQTEYYRVSQQYIIAYR